MKLEHPLTLSDACFTEYSSEEFERRRNVALSELLHGVPRKVGNDNSQGKCLSWSVYGILHEPAHFTTFIDLVERAISELGWECDVICSASVSAATIAGALIRSLNARYICVDNATFAFLPREIDPKQQERVLVIDTRIGTGSHLDLIRREIRKNGGSYVGCIVVAIDDFTPNEHKLASLDELLDKKRIIYLHRMSDGYNRWLEGLLMPS